jgi:hypothetical protein
LLSQVLSRGNADAPTLLAEVTQVQEAALVVEATCVIAMLATKTSARETAVAWDKAVPMLGMRKGGSSW